MKQLLILLFLIPIFAMAQNKVLLRVQGANRVDTIYRKAGQDSIFYKINGTERAIKDSLGITDTTSLSNRINAIPTVTSYAKNAGGDSTVLLLSNGQRFAAKDSAGGGGIAYDTLAIRKIGPHYIGFNSGFGGTGTSGGSPTVGTNTAIDSGNIFIARNAGAAITTGWGNIGIGGRALFSATTTTRQIAIGQGALSSLTNASGTEPNIAIGQSALASNNGTRNIAIGVNAASSYTGNQIVAIGWFALQPTTGTGNTGIGYFAGSATTTGQNNSFLGNSAGNQFSGNTTGSNNSGLGAFTLADGPTTGSNNTAVGSQSMYKNGLTTQNNTTSIGAFSGRYNTGNFGVYIGSEAGLGTATSNRLHSGNYNIGIGYRALYNTSDTIKGNNNIVIGDRLSIPNIDADNQVVIGSNGINWLTRFTGGGCLVNNTTSAVTAQTAGASLEVKSTTGTFMPPVMTGVQATALGASPDGSIIYVTATDGVFTSVGFWGMIAGTWTALHL